MTCPLQFVLEPWPDESQLWALTALVPGAAGRVLRGGAGASERSHEGHLGSCLDEACPTGGRDQQMTEASEARNSHSDRRDTRQSTIR